MFRRFSFPKIVFSLEGITLLEALVSAAISATLLLIAAPAVFSGLSKYALYTAARQMATDIRGWQQQSLATMDTTGTYLVQFDLSREAYYLMRNVTIMESRQLPVYLDLETTKFPSHELRFNLKGVPSTGGTVTLRERLTGKRYYVIVAPVAGRVRVSPYPPMNEADY